VKRVLERACVLAALGLLVSVPSAHAVKKFKTSNYGGGAQIWFEAEDFDGRDSTTYYQLRKAEANLKLTDGANGDALTNAVGGATPDTAWVRYNFDIRAAGGKAGTWYLWGRIISPNNQSDWLWIRGEQGNTVPTKRFDNPENGKHRIFEETVAAWGWIGGKPKGEGHVRPLTDGENVMVIFWRQSDNTDEFDVLMWADKEDYKPTDDDYKNAKLAGAAAVDPYGKAAIRWAEMKAAR
jgi:hypothetical protein